MNQIHYVHELLCRAVGSASSLDTLDREVRGVGPGNMPDPSYYHFSESFFRDSQCYHFLRKMEPASSDSKESLRAAAIEAFIAAEKECEQTNRRFINFRNGYFKSPDELRLFQYLEYAKRIVHGILKRAPDVDEIPFTFGTGSCVGSPYKKRLVPYKITDNELTISHGCLSQHARQLAEMPWLQASNRTDDLIVIDYNEFTTVPKDRRKDRGICKEPLLNVGFQLGVGQAIKKRLNRIGLLKNSGMIEHHAQSQHRRLAMLGSINRHLGTIDLSSASDTVSLELVRYLIPDDWFALLLALRARYTHINDKHHLNQKFSSMGNGFTFELETLVFYAICSSITNVYGVYGDDIIVPTEDCLAVMELLKFCGFSINNEKSYWDPECKFRESCGGDYFNGFNVRPAMAKKEPTEPNHWFSIHNSLYRAYSQSKQTRQWMLPAMAYVVEQIPKGLRLYGPPSLGDTVLHSESYNERVTALGPMVKAFVPVGNKAIIVSELLDQTAMLYRLYNPPAGPFAHGDTVLSDSVSGYRVKWVYTIPSYDDMIDSFLAKGVLLSPSSNQRLFSARNPMTGSNGHRQASDEVEDPRQLSIF